MSDDDTVDGGLIDVSELTLAELADEVDGSSLAAALQRIFARQEEGVNYSFVSNI
jgi:FXSXX-COOH protein